MRVIARRTLRTFWTGNGHADAEQPLRAWFAEARKAIWKKPSDVKDHYRTASIPGAGRIVFNIAGNKYRLVVTARYDLGILFVRFIGTHQQYDAINVKEV